MIVNKLRHIVSNRYNNKIFLLIILLIIGMIIEAFGLGIVIPVLSTILEPKTLLDYDFIFNLFELINIKTDVEIRLFILSFLISIYLFKALFLIFLSYFQFKFLGNLSYHLTNKLFGIYLQQPYKFYLNNNSSELVKDIQVEITLMISFLQSVIAIVTESFLVLSVLITLIFIEPTGAIYIIFFFSFFSIIYFQLTRKKLSIWGKERQAKDSKIYRTVMESLSGIKSIKVLVKENFFKKILMKSTRVKYDIFIKQNTVNLIPRHYLEFLTILGLSLLILIVMNKHEQLNNVIISIGVCLAAIFRILPSFNRIISSIQNLKFHAPSVESVYQAFTKNDLVNKDYNLNDKKILVFKEKISLKNISFSYDRFNNILNDANFEIRKGESIGIIGQSGQGKSTLADLITGLLEPNKGQIKVDGTNMKNLNLISWKKNIGYVPQEIFLIDDSIKNNIALGVSDDQISLNRLNKAINKSQLINFVNSLNKKIDTKVGERGVQLSGGQRQRIGIARALYNDPEILILDEATSSLDVKTEKEFMNAINLLKREKTLIIISHRFSTIKDCDKIYEIKNKTLKKIDINEKQLI
ncbi:MAG: hypothetical protein CMC88_04000 [Flavobacteriaceae bacterium]|nr:hypothetical protein [Flavobacteriaceae bacterium]|tara:strand:- start:102387 stop:104132 length:1746 start_codon:yes stop_codon:yes gene_type:complete